MDTTRTDAMALPHAANLTDLPSVAVVDHRRRRILTFSFDGDEPGPAAVYRFRPPVNAPAPTRSTLGTYMEFADEFEPTAVFESPNDIPEAVLPGRVRSRVLQGAMRALGRGSGMVVFEDVAPGELPQEEPRRPRVTAPRRGSLPALEPPDMILVGASPSR